jgi:hypothetical protein
VIVAADVHLMTIGRRCRPASTIDAFFGIIGEVIFTGTFDPGSSVNSPVRAGNSAAGTARSQLAVPVGITVGLGGQISENYPTVGGATLTMPASSIGCASRRVIGGVSRSMPSTWRPVRSSADRVCAAVHSLYTACTTRWPSACWWCRRTAAVANTVAGHGYDLYKRKAPGTSWTSAAANARSRRGGSEPVGQQPTGRFRGHAEQYRHASRASRIVTWQSARKCISHPDLRHMLNVGFCRRFRPTDSIGMISSGHADAAAAR